MDEIWKDINGYEGYYQVSNLGRVKSLDRLVNSKNNSKRLSKGYLLKQVQDKYGYLKVCLSIKHKHKSKFVHRLVAEAFIENPDNLPVINHKDENPSNNNVSNLEWCTVGYNNTYGTRIERVFKNQKKQVYQYNVNGELVGLYESIKDAALNTGCNKSNISNCCNGKLKMHKGYMWSFFPM